MSEIKRPDDTTAHLEQVEQIDEIVEYLLGQCEPDETMFQKAKRVSARLKSLMTLFREGGSEDGVNVSVYGFVHRLDAKKNGHLDRTPDKKETDPQFSNGAESIIDWLSDTSGDSLPSDELIGKAAESFGDASSLASTKNALNEIFETMGGQVRLKEKALLAIRAKIVEKTGEAIPQESRNAVETALKSGRPFDDGTMKAGLLQDGGNAFKKHPDGKIVVTGAAMKHMLAKILFKGPRGKEGYADGADNDRREAQDLG